LTGQKSYPSQRDVCVYQDLGTGPPPVYTVEFVRFILYVTLSNEGRMLHAMMIKCCFIHVLRNIHYLLSVKIKYKLPYIIVQIVEVRWMGR
jgi:hypothetical protein